MKWFYLISFTINQEQHGNYLAKRDAEKTLQFISVIKHEIGNFEHSNLMSKNVGDLLHMLLHALRNFISYIKPNGQMHLRRNQFLIKAPKGAQSIKLSLVDERREEVSQISESDFCRRRKWEFSIWSALPPRTSISAPPSCMLGKRQHNLRTDCVWLQNIVLFGCSNGPRLTFLQKK